MKILRINAQGLPAFKKIGYLLFIRSKEIFHFCGKKNAPGVFVPSAFSYFPNKALCASVRDNVKTSESFSIR